VPPAGWLQGHSLITQKDPNGDEMDVDDETNSDEEDTDSDDEETDVDEQDKGMKDSFQAEHSSSLPLTTTSLGGTMAQ
jgi:hypothetical protein